ncbi:MEKHLA domain-containing protein [Actibacterium pelagium]|uniref:MEKHLA domain-containing protein n=1 Tax=Actibacterium pelagium TaxID=2029103 RepID=A0A917ABN1_9RHOB|nr:MEKHLA domain-containing protein [Actibacterium pelagium]GGE40796.1 MEKHLA domain-containing protein [Actibacterium pelagium]
MDCPAPENGYQADHAQLLLRSYQKCLWRPLLPQCGATFDVAKALFESSAVVLSHNGAADPILTYGNRAALELWEMDWDTLTQMPSRLTAEPEEREARAALLSSIRDNGYIDNYRGIRISATGKRFYIEDAVIWTLTDAAGHPCGQAATFSKVTPL